MKTPVTFQSENLQKAEVCFQQLIVRGILEMIYLIRLTEVFKHHLVISGIHIFNLHKTCQLYTILSGLTFLRHNSVSMFLPIIFIQKINCSDNFKYKLLEFDYMFNQYQNGY